MTSVNAVMTITYWLIGRRIIEQEQQGAARAGYGMERSCSTAWPAIFPSVSVVASPNGILANAGLLSWLANSADSVCEIDRRIL